MIRPSLSLLGCAFLAATPSLHAASQLPAKTSAPRVVPCDKPVKSEKRGICMNKMDRADFMALAPSVSWWYNWFYKDTTPAPAEAKMEFLPMAWGDREDDLKGLKAYLASNKPKYVLAINEPNLKGQAFISPEKTATLYKKIKAIADTHKIPVIGPHMALGSSPGDSIKAMDPIEKKETTYTFMGPFLKAFFHYMGNTEVVATSSHSYGNFGELKWMVESMYKDYGNRPVWVTEFADWHAANEEAEINYMIQCVDFMERTPYVAGYAWFKERVGGNQKLSLLKESGKLTKLGEAYVNMPVHDPNVYYQLPGRLQAESYVAMNGADISLTKDAEGFLEMQVMSAQNWVDYNVSVTAGGPKSVKVRFASAGESKIEILAGEKVLTTVESQGKGWQTGTAIITLPSGLQTIRVRPTGAVRLNWMEFGS